MVSIVTGVGNAEGKGDNGQRIYKIMNVLAWRTVYALTRGLFWCLFPELREISILFTVIFTAGRVRNSNNHMYPH